MVPTPVTVQANVIVPLESTISGDGNYVNYGVSGKNPEATNGITVTFYDLSHVDSNMNSTIPEEYQIDEIIFRKFEI